MGFDSFVGHEPAPAAPRRSKPCDGNDAELPHRGRAQEALRLGLVNQCLADEDFFDVVDAYAQQVLANSWFSHRANKKLLVQTDGLPLGAGLAQEVYRHEGVGPDVHARIASFLQKKSSKS